MIAKIIIDGIELTAELIDDFAEYKKKPVIIRAAQLANEIDIPTLEGTMRGNVGDWLIIGTHGEIYPCKPEIFVEIYENANKT